MRQTPNYKLNLIDDADPFNQSSINANFTKIDSTLKSLASADSTLSTKVTKLQNSIPAAFPSGGIIIWSGTANNIPSGWKLCDGTNGTPDLRSRFVIGASSTYAKGSIGGEATHKLTTSELPSHVHIEMAPVYETRDLNVNTNYCTDPTKFLGVVNLAKYVTRGTSAENVVEKYAPVLHAKRSTSVDIQTNTGHTASGVGDPDQIAMGPVGYRNGEVYTYGTKYKTAEPLYTQNTGGNVAHNNIPPYYALCYIMKV